MRPSLISGLVLALSASSLSLPAAADTPLNQGDTIPVGDRQCIISFIDPADGRVFTDPQCAPSGLVASPPARLGTNVFSGDRIHLPRVSEPVCAVGYGSQITCTTILAVNGSAFVTAPLNVSPGAPAWVPGSGFIGFATDSPDSSRSVFVRENVGASGLGTVTVPAVASESIAQAEVRPGHLPADFGANALGVAGYAAQEHELAARLAKLESDIKDANRERGQAITVARRIESNLPYFQSQVDRRKKIVGSLTTEAERLRGILSEQNEQRVALSNQLAAIEGLSAEMQEYLEKSRELRLAQEQLLVSPTPEVAAQATALSNRLVELQARLHDHVTQVDRLGKSQADVALLVAEHESLTRQLSEATAVLVRLQQQRQQVASLSAEVEQLARTRDELLESNRRQAERIAQSKPHSVSTKMVNLLWLLVPLLALLLAWI